MTTAASATTYSYHCLLNFRAVLSAGTIASPEALIVGRNHRSRMMNQMRPSDLLGVKLMIRRSVTKTKRVNSMPDPLRPVVPVNNAATKDAMATSVSPPDDKLWNYMEMNNEKTIWWTKCERSRLYNIPSIPAGAVISYATPPLPHGNVEVEQYTNPETTLRKGDGGTKMENHNRRRIIFENT